MVEDEKSLSEAQIGQATGGVFENLGTTLNIGKPPRVPFVPPEVLLGLCQFFSN